MLDKLTRDERTVDGQASEPEDNLTEDEPEIRREGGGLSPRGAFESNGRIRRDLGGREPGTYKGNERTVAPIELRH